MRLKVLLNSVEKATKFASIANSTNYDVDIISGRNTYLDGKSIMGILSCDISEPMTVIVNCHDEAELDRLRSQLSIYTA